jgi:ATP-dependent RNA helicase DeaD
MTTQHYFHSLGLAENVLRALTEMGFEAPTPVQSECIPSILEGRDIVGQAQTGTGKTAAFGVPVISKIDPNNRNVQALIQCPTRELAIQVTAELMKIGKYVTGLNVVPVYGGQPIPRQLTQLKRGAQIVVGTPGRTIDHLKRGSLKLENLSMLVFDEADEMLNMGFREDMEEILTYTKGKVQTIMFSATVPKPIREIMNRYMNNPVNVQIDRKAVTAPDIQQFVVEVRDSVRTEAISRLMDVHQFKLGLIFCNTKIQTETVARELQAYGFSTELLNGDLSQMQRDRVMQKFRSGEIDLLVATDVAARGIDVSDVDVVFNFEIPHDPEYYVHRIGRTGRAGKTGTSITFCSGRKNRRLSFIERQIGKTLQPMAMPSVSDVEASRISSQITELENALEKGGLKPFIEQIEIMAQGDYSTVEIAAALLKLRVGEVKNTAESTFDNSKGKKTFDNTQFDDSNMVRLHFNIGRKNKVSPGDFVGAIAGECGVPGNSIGQITIQQSFSFVDVPAQFADQVIDGMNRSQVKGNRVRVKAS